MQSASHILGMIGFGEAGQAFAGAGAWASRVGAYDRLTLDAATRAAKLADYDEAGVTGCDTLDQAVSGASLLLALVTADQAGAVAITAARSMRAGALYLDFNSVSPETKRTAARVIETAGGLYVDVAVMSPVHPARLAVPLLLSGASAQDAAHALTGLGFTHVRVVGPTVGRASSIKMIRSVMVKGIEALSAECVLAAEAAGVLDEVIASLNASGSGSGCGDDWASRADYNLDRMMAHGLRRAAEMEEVVRTLDDLGTGSVMSRATAKRQRAIGRLGLKAPPSGLAAKIAAVLNDEARAA